MKARASGAEMLTLVGVTLYGEQWKRKLAAAVSVDEKQVRRWLDADGPPTDVMVRLCPKLYDRENSLMAVRHSLSKWLASV